MSVSDAERLAKIETQQEVIDKNVTALWAGVNKMRSAQTDNHLEVMQELKSVAVRVQLHSWILKGLTGITATAGAVVGYFKVS